MLALMKVSPLLYVGPYALESQHLVRWSPSMHLEKQKHVQLREEEKLHSRDGRRRAGGCDTVYRMSVSPKSDPYTAN